VPALGAGEFVSSSVNGERRHRFADTALAAEEHKRCSRTFSA
jgi:hypothetical protein